VTNTLAYNRCKLERLSLSVTSTCS